MAIVDEINKENSSSPSPSQNMSSSGPVTFHNSNFFSAMTDGADSEYFNRFLKTATEILKAQDSHFDIALVSIERKNFTELVFDALVVAVKQKGVSGIVAYHPLLLEATGSKNIEPIKESFGNGPMIEIKRYTADAVDAVFVKLVNEKVTKAFPSSRNVMVDATVVPTEFNPDDRDAVKRLLANAANAGSTEIQVHRDNYQGLNLMHLEKNVNLTIDQTFTTQTLTNIVGQPTRSDIMVTFGSHLNDQTQQNKSIVNNGGKQIKVSQLSGFIDLIYLDPQDMPQPQLPYGYAQPQQPTQRFAPRLVITDIGTGMFNEPSAVLLALATANTLNDVTAVGGVSWWQTFRPTRQRAGQQIDLRDIGALNHDVNLANEAGGVGSKIDTKSETFDLGALGDFIRAAIHPGMVISLDVPDCGPSTWYTSQFSAASAQKGPAYDAIYTAANNLTNGIFGKYFQTGMQMFTDLNNRVHMGYYIDNFGEKRDIRDIDHLAICNLFGQERANFIRAFSDTYLRTEYPIVQRLAEREKLIMGCTGDKAVFTGLATRVTFTKEFLGALARSILETGLPVRVNTSANANDFLNRRGSGGFVPGALSAPAPTFYQQPQAGAQGAWMYGNASGGYRW